ncbi:hypothetical protein [Salipiger bermudensis]|uniref:hypothetical protein n=1 Tax=Salipiger bermudensis TaxID=344736 RepID=UPI001CD3365A|nr:hypothetical protein [Salipiger bermudensis]MCA1288627.1 hypothetical protein [Salipiger bermudensis]
MNTKTETASPIVRAQLGRAHVAAACLTVLTREVHTAGLEKQDALDLLRDAPDKIDAALTRGSRALVVYRLDKRGARGLVTDSDSRLNHFAAVADQDGAPLFGFCPGAIAELAAYIDTGAASLKKDA